MSDMDEPDEQLDEQIIEIARQHPSAGDGTEAEGAEQEGNLEGVETAEDGGTGAGEDYAGSGF